MARRERTQFDYDVFLSHSSEDKPVVRSLAERLRDDGLAVWLDDWMIEPGTSVSGTISDGLENSRVLLMLLSEHFDESDWTHFEGAPFLFSDPTNKRRQFIPVRLDDAEIPFRLKDFAWVDWRTREDEQYARLLSACRRGGGSLPPPDPAEETVPGRPGSTSRTEAGSLSHGPETPAPRPPTPFNPFSLGHTGAIRGVALTADGTRAVSGSSDNTVRVWDLESGQCTATLEGHCGTNYGWGTIRSVQFTPDGTFELASAATNGVLRLWLLKGGGRGGGGGAEEPAAARYTNAKVLLVGESGVGKTGLARRMATGEFELTQSTDGHWATRLKASYHDDKWATRVMLNADVTDDGTRREIWLWDFAGQADYRLIHQLFMDETSLAVLVFNPQSDEVFDALGRWDTDLARASRKPYRKLLVAGRIDRGGLRASKEHLNAFLDARNFDGYLETSEKNGSGCEELVQQICSTIDWDSLSMTVSNVTWDRLKSEIIAIRDGRSSHSPHRPRVGGNMTGSYNRAGEDAHPGADETVAADHESTDTGSVGGSHQAPTRGR